MMCVRQVARAMTGLTLIYNEPPSLLFVQNKSEKVVSEYRKVVELLNGTQIPLFQQISAEIDNIVAG